MTVLDLGAAQSLEQPRTDSDLPLELLHTVAALIANGATPAAVLRAAAEAAAVAMRCPHGAVVLEGGIAVYEFGAEAESDSSGSINSISAPVAGALTGACGSYRFETPIRHACENVGVLLVGSRTPPTAAFDLRVLKTLAVLIAPAVAAAGMTIRDETWVPQPGIEPLLESMSDAVALVDTAGKLRMANAAYRRLMLEAGVDEGPLAASDVLIQIRDRNGKPVRPEDRAHPRALEGRTTRGDRTLRMADGRDRVFALHGSPVLDQQGTVSGVAIVLRDITDQIARERALRLMEEVRRGLSLSGDLQHAARAVCRRAISLLSWVKMASVYGLDGGDLVLLAQAGFPTRAARLLAGMALGPMHRAGQAVQDNRPTIFHADRDEPASESARRFVVASGAATFVNLPLVAGTSAFGLLVLAGRDHRVPSRDELALLEALATQVGAELEGVRRREQAETERARLQAVLNQLPEGVLLLDEAGRLVMSNRSAEEILGQPVDPATPVVALAARLGFLHADGRPYLPGGDPIATAFSTGQAVLGEEQLVRRTDGRDLPVVSNVAPIRDSGGQLAAVIMVFQDITSLREMDRIKDEFVSIAGHELRTPIASIRGMAQLLLRRADRLDREAVNAALSTIVDQIDAMSGLVDDLLDMSRIRNGRLSLQFADVDLVDAIKRPFDHAILQREAVQISVAGPLIVHGDRRRLSQVFSNLLDNAIKYSAPGNSVEVTVGSSGGDAVVTVRDHGIGIPAEDLDRVFDRFFRAENASAYAGGIGLGLYLCREIVERHGGRIAIDSELGQGTTFTVRLPLATDPPE